MDLRIILVCVVMCVVIIEVQSDKCDKVGKTPVYARVKRAKYYSNPPPRFYKLPPRPVPVKGVYSLTPPPSYMIDEEQYPPGYKPQKVSKKPHNEGLGDEDFNNMIKYLSKKDLDKVIKFAYEKERTQDIPFESRNPIVFDDSNFKTDFNKFTINDANIKKNVQKLYDSPKSNVHTHSNDIDIPLEFQEFVHNSHTDLNSAEDDVNETPVYNNKDTIYTDSDTMKEETLPRPVNLRDNLEYDASYTNNVPSIIKAESTSYQIENFGDIPLMNYNSKLHTVSSYHVPHYSVITPNKSTTSSRGSASSGKIPELEPAPPVSYAKEQSDAHLKAIKIWTHRSKGTAYYLHDDGTLSLEKPQRPKHYR